MALKPLIEKLEDVEEPLRTLYAEKDGKFVLDIEGGYEDTTQLKTTVSRLRKTSGDLERKVKQWETLGKTPDEITELLAEIEELRAKDGGDGNNTDIEKIKAQMNERHQREMKAAADSKSAAEKERDQLRTELFQTKIDNALTTAIATENGNVRLVLKIARDFVQMQEENGKVVMRVVDEDGTVRVNGKGDPMSIAELVVEMKASDDYAQLFYGTGSSGSGSRAASGNSGSHQYRKKSDFKSEKERAEFIDKHGLPAYTALPWN